MSNHTPPSTFSPLLGRVNDREGGYGKGLPRSLEDTYTHHTTPRHATSLPILCTKMKRRQDNGQVTW